MNPLALGLALILTGIIFTALGAVNIYYDRLVFRNTEECDAVITKLRRIQGKSWNPNVCIQINAEYSVDGRLVAGSYYTLLISSIVKYEVGESVTVEVNPKNPKAFRIREIEETTEMQYTKKRSPIITGIGLAILAAGIIVIIMM